MRRRIGGGVLTRVGIPGILEWETPEMKTNILVPLHLALVHPWNSLGVNRLDVVELDGVSLRSGERRIPGNPYGASVGLGFPFLLPEGFGSGPVPGSTFFTEPPVSGAKRGHFPTE